MVGKKSGKALLREEGMYSETQRLMMDYIFSIPMLPSANTMAAGLERTDNSMELTSWPQVTMINQKNYYT